MFTLRKAFICSAFLGIAVPSVVSATTPSSTPKPTATQSNLVPVVHIFSVAGGNSKGSIAMPTSPAPLYIKVKLVAAGGGGAGSTASGGTGGDTSFGPVDATGGTGGAPGAPNGSGVGGQGGQVLIEPDNNPVGIPQNGGSGQGSSNEVSVTTAGGQGASSIFGGGGGGAAGKGNGQAGASLTGGGGGGAGGQSNAASGAGGGAGAGMEFMIPGGDLRQAYDYSVGTGGAGGGGVGTGGKGSDGLIILTEYFQ